MHFVTLCLAIYFLLIPRQDEKISSVDSITVGMKQGISIELVFVASGEFTMGRHIGVAEIVIRTVDMLGSALDEGPAHIVRLTKGFYMSRYKITAEQFCTYLNAVDKEQARKSIAINKRSVIHRNIDGAFEPKKGFEQCAVNTVPWEGAKAYCEWLTGDSGWAFRLPTEAEWEFTARGVGGRHTPWKGDIGLPKYDSDKPVNAFPKNSTPEGVVGMINSVGDWVSDFYSKSHANELQIDPIGPPEADFHVLKRCLDFAYQREIGGPVGTSGISGFRVLLEANDNGEPRRVKQK